ncbi:MAG TPA: hypothetical protein VGU43_07435 [Thermoplasmata archaeon]|nr:hypothetical protein [Thermoplasmata archaeon]
MLDCTQGSGSSMLPANMEIVLITITFTPNGTATPTATSSPAGTSPFIPDTYFPFNSSSGAGPYDVTLDVLKAPPSAGTYVVGASIAAASCTTSCSGSPAPKA